MIDPSAPWHTQSFDRFVHERLPALLGERLPLVDVHVEPIDTYTFALQATFAAQDATLQTRYEGLPRPDADGVFLIDGREYVVIPIAADDQLNTTAVRCVGEQLYEMIAAQLGALPHGLPLTEELLRAWLPLDSWLREFFAGYQEGRAMPQSLDDGNWLARHEHLRRVFLAQRSAVFNASQLGRVCPFETPEGSNIGRYAHVALGATIRDGRLISADDRPVLALGLAASTIPFLEHDDPFRLLMGTNMLRQWMTPPRYWAQPAAGEARLLPAAASDAPEPALVQTGLEPEAARFWAGRNLLTAFIAWGEETFEDALILSESGARRLGYPKPVEPGDKLSNRHGTKGVVSRILPDAAMPQLPDGTPVELVFHSLGLISRMNFGQVREALMSRIARAEGRPAIVPPFAAPGDAELRERMAAVGIADDGLQQLSRAGEPLERRSLVGWVYWGRLFHQAGDKLIAFTDGADGLAVGEAEYAALREAGAFETIREHFNTAAVQPDRAEHLRDKLAAGPLTQTDAPSPQLAALMGRLRVAGIAAERDGAELRFRFAERSAAALQLAAPVPHPWLRERMITQIDSADAALIQANERLARMLAGNAPASLAERASAELANRVREVLDGQLAPEHLRFASRVCFTGRAVLAPGADLRYDQVGIPDMLAWALFGPLLTRELGGAAENRDAAAADALDALMARAWVLVHRPAVLSPTTFVAYHPVRIPERVVRVHPSAAALLEADFDGDQAAIMLPLTEAAQREAGALLSVAAQLGRNPQLAAVLYPRIEALWGLAALSLTREGRAEIDALAGLAVATPSGFVDKWALTEALRTIVERDGAERALETLERLRRRGFEIATASGLSLSPFFGSALPALPAPPDDDAHAWSGYGVERTEQLVALRDFLDADLGPWLLAARSGARGNLLQMITHLGPRGIVDGVDNRPSAIRHGFREGLEPEELFALAAAMRKSLAALNQTLVAAAETPPSAQSTSGSHVLARARRSAHPGIVFARAAAAGEADPLTDPDSRLFAGLGV